MATVVDVLKYVITGDNTGLVAAAKGGDAAVNTMSQNITAGLTRVGLQFAAVAAAAFSFDRILRATVGEALESERVFTALAGAVAASGQNWQENEIRVRGFLKALQETSRFTDEEAAGALKILIQSGMSVQQAMSLMQTAMDAAVATGTDLASVAEVLGTAFQGNARGARQLGIVLQETGKEADVLGELVGKMQERFGGAAQKDTETAIGQWQRFSKTLHEFGENIGNIVLPGLQSLLEGLNNFVNASAWKQKLDKNTILGALFHAAGFDQLAAGFATKSAMADMFAGFARGGEIFGLGALPHSPLGGAPITTASSEVTKKAAEERAKWLFDALKTAKDAYYDDVMKDEEELERERIEGLEASFEFARQQQEKQRRLQEFGFRSLLDNAHRLASEFGRFMSEAVENFLHTALDAIGEIKDSLAQIKLGGINAVAGGLGLFGSVFGVVSSIVDMFSSGTKAIQKSNLEVVKAIREWISNLRGATKAELGATEADVLAAIKELARLRGLQDVIGTKFIDQFAHSIEGFDEVAQIFKERMGRSGSFEEVFQFWLQLLKEQGNTFNIIASGLKTVEDVKKFLKDQTKLDFQTGRQFIEFFTSQNKFTPEQQKLLFEDLLAILQASGNITTSELIDLTELIRQLSENQAGITEEAIKEMQITRSVASITENQANLVVGFLQTIAATTQSILEAIENAVSGLGAVPFGGSTNIQAGAIVINAAGAGPEAISRQLMTDLRAKGVKV